MSKDLEFYCEQVARMKPGQRLDIDVRDLQRIHSYEHNGATFTPADRILGNIMGSAYTHSFEMDPFGRKVTFVRHENTGERRHNDPDDEFRLRMIEGRIKSWKA